MVERVTVIGAGTMGLGIAQVTAIHGIETILCDLSEDLLSSACSSIDASVAKGIDKGKTGPEARENVQQFLTTSVSTVEACAESSFIIEAVPESLELKSRIFQEVEEVCDSSAILATNTSTLDIDEIAAATRRPDQVIGTHFFSPAHVMRLMENVRGEKTSKQTIATVMNLSKTMVIC